MNAFRLLIPPQAQCELKSVDGSWRQAFLSVKGAMDYLGCLDEADVTVVDGHQETRLFIPKAPFPASRDDNRLPIALSS